MFNPVIIAVGGAKAPSGGMQIHTGCEMMRRVTIAGLRSRSSRILLCS